ncbi:hypothetical protein FRC03_007725 [Tulasnella sp. 419]|nr:hypothetical protein FRC03_007725 [Tulasnella sp. 419]
MNWSNDGEILPLKGDGQGRYRVRITGNSGVGKSTLAKKLSIALGYAPVLHMDEIFWQPGWATASTMEFNSKLQDFLRSNEGGSCIIDGNYRSEIDWGMKEMNDLTDVIWLDPPLLVYFWGLFGRTLRRLLGLEAPCSEGCPERWSEAFFSKKSIIWWCVTNHQRFREGNEGYMKKAEGGSIRWLRFSGWNFTRKRDEWLRAVRMIVKQV